MESKGKDLRHRGWMTAPVKSGLALALDWLWFYEGLLNEGIGTEPIPRGEYLRCRWDASGWIGERTSLTVIDRVPTPIKNQRIALPTHIEQKAISRLALFAFFGWYHALRDFGEIFGQLVKLIEARCIRCQETKIHIRPFIDNPLFSQHPEFFSNAGYLLLENQRFSALFHGQPSDSHDCPGEEISPH